MKLNKFIVVAGLAVGLGVSNANAFVFWNNASSTAGAGGNSVISWTGGGSDNGLFGSPDVVGDTFFFLANSNFDADANASNGYSQTTTDTLRVTVTAQGFGAFTEILFRSAGDYTVYGTGSSIDVSGSLTVTDANNLANTLGDPLHTTPLFPQIGNDLDVNAGEWSGFSSIDMSVFGFVTSIDVVFTNSLIALCLPGETASIATLPITEGAFSLTIVPAPATALTALLGLGVFARRRR